MKNQQAAAEEALLGIEQSKLPFFHADPKKDHFTGDQWLERFENSRVSGQWNGQRTKSYFHNAMRGDALQWYRMLSVAKMDIDNYEELCTAFIMKFGVKTNNYVVFSNTKQGKEETVQEFFVRIGYSLHNYNLKKPQDEIMGDLPDIPEDQAEDLAAWNAMPIAQRRKVHQLCYEQFDKNDISYMALQFFIAGLHPDLRLEVIKSKTLDFYQAFKIAHAYETAVKSLKERDQQAKVNEMDVTFEEAKERADIKAHRRMHNQRRMFQAKNGLTYQPQTYGNFSSNSGNGSNYSYGSNHSYGNNDNGYQQTRSGASRKPNPAFGKTCHYCKKKNHFQRDCFTRKRDNAPLVKVQKVCDK